MDSFEENEVSSQNVKGIVEELDEPDPNRLKKIQVDFEISGAGLGVILFLAVSDDQKSMIVVSNENYVSFVDLKTRKVIGKFRGVHKSKYIRGCAFRHSNNRINPDKYVAASTSAAGDVVVFEKNGINEFGIREELDLPSSDTEDGRAVDFAPAGGSCSTDIFVVAMDPSRIAVWDSDNQGKCKLVELVKMDHLSLGSSSYTQDAKFDPSGRLVAVAAKDSVCLVETETWICVRAWRGRGQNSFRLGFFPNQQQRDLMAVGVSIKEAGGFTFWDISIGAEQEKRYSGATTSVETDFKWSASAKMEGTSSAHGFQGTASASFVDSENGLAFSCFSQGMTMYNIAKKKFTATFQQTCMYWGLCKVVQGSKVFIAGGGGTNVSCYDISEFTSGPKIAARMKALLVAEKGKSRLALQMKAHYNIYVLTALFVSWF